MPDLTHTVAALDRALATLPEPAEPDSVDLVYPPPTITPSLAELRRLAAAHDLAVRVLRVDGDRYVTLHEPEAPTVAVVTAEARRWPLRLGSDSMGRTDPRGLAAHLDRYRAAHPRAAFTASPPGVEQWSLRLAQLAADAHTVGPGDPAHIETCAAVRAALDGQPGAAEHLAAAERSGLFIAPGRARARQLRLAAERFGGHYLDHDSIGYRGTHAAAAAAAPHVVAAHIDPHSPAPATPQEHVAVENILVAVATGQHLDDPEHPDRDAELHREDRAYDDADLHDALSHARAAASIGDAELTAQWLDAAELAAPHRGDLVEAVRTEHTALTGSPAAALAAQAQTRPATASAPTAAPERPAAPHDQLRLDHQHER